MIVVLFQLPFYSYRFNHVECDNGKVFGFHLFIVYLYSQLLPERFVRLFLLYNLAVNKYEYITIYRFADRKSSLVHRNRPVRMNLYHVETPGNRLKTNYFLTRFTWVIVSPDKIYVRTRNWTRVQLPGIVVVQWNKTGEYGVYIILYSFGEDARGFHDLTLSPVDVALPVPVIYRRSARSPNDRVIVFPLLFR